MEVMERDSNSEGAVRGQVCCSGSGAKHGGQCDDEDEGEDGQTDGDPNLLLHRNKEHVHLAPELMRP